MSDGDSREVRPTIPESLKATRFSQEPGLPRILVVAPGGELNRSSRLLL